MKPANILDITRNRNVSLSHRCSLCGYTMLQVCTVQTIVRTGYEFAAAKAQAHAEETAKSQMDALVADIASCREKPHSLARLSPNSKQNPWLGITELEIDSKTRSITRITNLNDPCPRCGNQEPWQKLGERVALRTLPPESFPTVYEDFARAEFDALLELQSVLEDNEAVRLDAERLAAAQAENDRLLAERDAAAEELQDDSVQLQISALEAQKAQFESDQKAAGLFALKQKKELGAKIDALKGQIEELQKQNKEKKDSLNKTIRQDSFALERLAVLFARNGAKVEQCWGANAKTLWLYPEEQN